MKKHIYLKLITTILFANFTVAQTNQYPYMIEMKKENDRIKLENDLIKKNQIDLEKKVLMIQNK